MPFNFIKGTCMGKTIMSLHCICPSLASQRDISWYT